MASAASWGTLKNPVKYLNQDFEELRAMHLASKTLFQDDQFPPGAAALGYNEEEPEAEKNIEWKRPSAIHKDPQFMVDGATRWDVVQGMLGALFGRKPENSSVQSSISSMTLNKDLLAQVVPPNQSFKKEEYAGIFHFMMWQYGEWMDVVVDDLLPTTNKGLRSKRSTEGTEGTEFWSALMEKAYAKLSGSYNAARGVTPAEALEDFTGGMADSYSWSNPPSDLFHTIQNGLKEDSFIACYSRGGNEDKGLVTQHSYSVTGAEEVVYKGQKVQLVKIRSPRRDQEWNKAWSYDAPEWNDVDPKVKEALLIKKNDGEFWMSYPDFIQGFSSVDICHFTPDLVPNQKWLTTMLAGSWVEGSTAGGNKDYPATFWKNPQFYIKLQELDHKGPSCTMLVGLMQKTTKGQWRIWLEIGFTVYKVPKELYDKTSATFDKDFFEKNVPVDKTDFSKSREVRKRMELPVGDYIIVPSTSKPSVNGEFRLRIFTQKPVKVLKLGDGANPKP